MVESYKLKSKIATAIGFIAGLIVYLGKDNLTQILPARYASLVSVIIIAAGYVLAQTTENKRVEVAKQLVLENIENQAPNGDADGDQ